jgi:hypothetical protein
MSKPEFFLIDPVQVQIDITKLDTKNDGYLLVLLCNRKHASENTRKLR